MNNTRTGKWAGSLFIAGAVLVNVPYTLLILNFNYPKILREDTATILTKFQEGGSILIWQWFAFAWVGLPLLIGVVLLDKLLTHYNQTLGRLATMFGVIALVLQIIGLLRWTFVVPILANIYTSPATDETSKAVVLIVFQAVHQFGGVLLGEHLGQLFIITWMSLVSILMLRAGFMQPWLGWFGLVASAVYLLAQADLFATVMPTFPVVEMTGLIGSLLWLVWMIGLGIYLLVERQPVENTPPYRAAPVVAAGHRG